MSRDAHHAGSNVALTATISIVRQRGEATGVSADRWLSNSSHMQDSLYDTLQSCTSVLFNVCKTYT